MYCSIVLFFSLIFRDLDLAPWVLDEAQKGHAKYNLLAASNHYGGLGGGHCKCITYDTEVFCWSKSFTLFGLWGRLANFLLVTWVSLHYNIYKNNVKLATVSSKHGKN